MNPIDNKTLQMANEEAIYNIYIYLIQKTTPTEDETLQSIVLGLETDLKNRKPDKWNNRDIARLKILTNAVYSNETLANSRIGNITYSKSGLTACSFTKPNGDVSVIFRGTGSGEWLDNGEGLSGIPQKNVYITYGKGGRAIYHKTVTNDYATTQQVEALNWFRRISSKSGWNKLTNITVSGHSKGGNKAQFVAIHSDLVDNCYSFDGQGFSPEALDALKNHYKTKYNERRQKIMSFATDNDYVNVLGSRLVPQNNIYYFQSRFGLHYMEAMLDGNGKFYPQSEQGELSKYVESVSQELISIDPMARQYVTLGVVDIFQKHFYERLSTGDDRNSIERVIADISFAVRSILR